MTKQEILAQLKEYQLKKKFAPDEATGYIGIANRTVYTELNQLINTDFIPLFIFLVNENRLIDEEVYSVLNKFFSYLSLRGITNELDTEDKEALVKVVMKVLTILQMEHIPIEFP